MHDIAVRVLVVGADEAHPGHRDTLALQAGKHACYLPVGIESADRLQLTADWPDPQLLAPWQIVVAIVQRRYFGLLRAPAIGVRQIQNQLLQAIVDGILDDNEVGNAGPVRGNLGLRQPIPVDVPVKIIGGLACRRLFRGRRCGAEAAAGLEKQ